MYDQVTNADTNLLSLYWGTAPDLIPRADASGMGAHCGVNGGQLDRCQWPADGRLDFARKALI
jgi:hypothetical protein